MIITEVEFAQAWHRLGLVGRPYPIEFPTVDGGGHVDPDLAAQLALLARPDVSVDGLLSDSRDLRVLCAACTAGGAIAVQTGPRIRVGPVRRDRLVAEVIALLPDTGPGPGSAVTVPKALFHEAVNAFADAGEPALTRVLRGGGVDRDARRDLAALVSSPRCGSGRLAATAHGRRTPALTWFDTAAGRYLTAVTRHDGVDQLTLAPADSAELARRLRAVVEP
ncbi:ESX secretion-associated protein EspG [Actinokineospora sp. 24-640]